MKATRPAPIWIAAASTYAAFACAATGCPLAVTDDYRLNEGDPGPTGSPKPTPEACGEGFECVPAINAGDYVRLETASTRACPRGWGSPAVYSDGTDPGCPCACSQTAGGICKPGKIIEYATSACGTDDAKDAHKPIKDGDCIDIFTGASGLRISKPSGTPGSCEPEGESPAPLSMILCALNAPAGPVCGEGMLCVPESRHASGKLCNLLPNGAACAAGMEPHPTVYPVLKDTRECECECGAPSPASCVGANVSLFLGTICAESLDVTLPAGDACTDTAALDTAGSVQVHTGTWTGGPCAPIDHHSGKQLLDTASAATLCCLP